MPVLNDRYFAFGNKFPYFPCILSTVSIFWPCNVNFSCTLLMQFIILHLYYKTSLFTESSALSYVQFKSCSVHIQWLCPTDLYYKASLFTESYVFSSIHCKSCSFYVQQFWLPYLHGNTDCFWYAISGIQECCT